MFLRGPSCVRAGAYFNSIGQALDFEILKLLKLLKAWESSKNLHKICGKRHLSKPKDSFAEAES